MSSPLPSRESLTVEFKSDTARLSDDELVLAVVCLANSEGGELFLGVGDDGRVTGLHAAHLNLAGLPAVVGNNTVPSVSVRVETLEIDGKRVARIEVPRVHALVASAKGTLVRRRLKHDGLPECTPFLPHEFSGRQADLRLLDPSAQPVPGATPADFDPAERQRLRSLIERFHGDAALGQLADDELEGALNLSTSADGQRVPTLAGMLLLGREDSLRRLVPSHEVVVQVLEGTDVRFNKTSRAPLLRSFEELLAWYEGQRREQEVEAGLFRVRVPNIAPRAFREAVVNALSHRDYTRLGPVRIAWAPERLTISNPGGFVEGVTIENILRTEPRPRNPSLADALKRIGLAERTGRGVDLLYESLLRYGRPGPDYADSNSSIVVLHLSSDGADPLPRLHRHRRLGRLRRRAGRAHPPRQRARLRGRGPLLGRAGALARQPCRQHRVPPGRGAEAGQAPAPTDGSRSSSPAYRQGCAAATSRSC